MKIYLKNKNGFTDGTAFVEIECDSKSLYYPKREPVIVAISKNRQRTLANFVYKSSDILHYLVTKVWEIISEEEAEKLLKIDTKQNHLHLKRDKNGKFLPKYIKEALFYYKGDKPIRSVQVIEKDNKYIKGFDLLDERKFKCFRRDKITNLRIIKTKIDN